MAIAGTMVPRGYYKDPERSARTFRVIDGVRHSLPGDMATVESDGSVRLIGRGNSCINTGGECSSRRMRARTVASLTSRRRAISRLDS